MTEPFSEADLPDLDLETGLDGFVDDYLSPGTEPPYTDRLLAIRHAEQRYGSLHPDDLAEYIRSGAPDLNHVASLVAVLQRKMRPLDDQYDRIDALPFTAVVSLEVYREILGIDSPVHLQGHLRRQVADGFRVHEFFGLDSIPHPNTLRKAEKERFDKHTNEFIARWGRTLTQIATRRGFYIPDVDEDRLSNNGGVTDIPIELKRGYAQGALDLLRDDIPISKNEEISTWTDYGKHFDFSLHLCASGNAPEAELENWADNRGLQTYDDVWATAETFRNDIYRVDASDWQDTLDAWTKRLLDAVYPESLRERYLPIAVDATNIPTWSSETSNLDGVVGTEKLKNTHYAYQILSAETVSDGLPFQVAHDLQLENRPVHEQMNDLLDKVEAHGVNPGVVFADADFASGRLVNELKGRGVDFVIAYPTHFVSSYTDEWEEAEQTFGVEREYVINKTKTAPKRAEVTLFGEYQSKVGHAPDDAQQTLSKYFDPGAEWVTDRQNQKTLEAYVERRDAEDVFEADNRMRWFTFVSNIDVNETEARALRQYYHYRWAIESAFSGYKSHFLPSTRSTELGLRTYLYLFGMAAYNAWVASNVKARRQHLEDNARKRPPIRASRFMTLGQQRYRDEFHREYINFRE